MAFFKKSTKDTPNEFASFGVSDFIYLINEKFINMN